MLDRLISGSQTSTYPHQTDSPWGVALRYGEYLGIPVSSGSNPRLQAGTLFPLGCILLIPMKKQGLLKIYTLSMQRLCVCVYVWMCGDEEGIVMKGAKKGDDEESVGVKKALLRPQA